MCSGRRYELFGVLVSGFVARHNVLLGTDTAPLGTDKAFACAMNSTKQHASDRCIDVDEGLLVTASGALRHADRGARVS